MRMLRIGNRSDILADEFSFVFRIERSCRWKLTIEMELDPVFTRRTIERLRASKVAGFGANGHEFELNPPISESAVCVFEKRHRISLPEDYRKCITQIGDGGTGPYYGVFPMGQMDDGFELSEWREGEGLVGVLSKDFPLREEWNDLSGMPREDLLDVDQNEYDRQVESFDTKYWTSTLTDGAIPICDQGCALRIWLVVKLARSGMSDAPSTRGFGPCSSKRGARDFLCMVSGVA